MTYLLDTNVISEARKSNPSPEVMAWLGSIPAESAYLSVMTLGEIRRGIERLRRHDAPQATRLERWLERLKLDYADRIIPVTGAIADEWGRLMVPDPLPTVDALLAATARLHGLTVVTRNTADLARTGIPVLNPFASPSV